MAAVPAATHARKFCLHQGFGSAQYRTDETHGWAAISSCRGGLRFCELHLFALCPRYNENPGAVLIRRPSGFGPVLWGKRHRPRRGLPGAAGFLRSRGFGSETECRAVKCAQRPEVPRHDKSGGTELGARAIWARKRHRASRAPTQL
jgi:hypothetical protein